MKKIIATILLLGLLSGFSGFIICNNKTKEVLEVYSPNKLGIDLNKDKVIDRDEVVCVAGIETFSLTPDDKFVQKYSKLFNLTRSDIISLGYLAQDNAAKTIENKNVSVKFSGKQNSECKFAKIKINGLNYKTILENSGFGIKNNKIGNIIKFKKNLTSAKKLHLVILNHHSNKYHTLDCKFAKLAHDTVIIPQKQLPKTAKPCRYCHNLNKKLKKKFHKHEKQKLYYFNYEIPKIPAPPTIISDGNISLYFTNFTKKLKPDNKCQTHVCKEFVKLTNNATESIDIAIFGYENVPEVTKALKLAKERGVKIRYVYDEYFNPAQNIYSGNDIIKGIAEISKSDREGNSVNSNMLMHNKFIIFDNKIVYTGSMNFSQNGLSGYDQNDIIVINSKEIAKLYSQEFEQMFSGKFHKDKIKNQENNTYKIGNSEIEVYFSPQDKSSFRIIQLIQNSKHYIYIPTFLITHSRISNELIKARQRGVDVRMIMDANNVHTKNTKHQILRKNGIPIKIESYAGKLHSKTMIIDDKYIIMGSMNFSNSGENKNDENMLVINNPRLAKRYKEFFNYLWAMIPNRYLKYNPKAESKDSIGSCFDGVDNNFNGKIDKQEDSCK